MRRPDLRGDTPGQRQNWWAAAVILLLAALGCVSAGFWAGVAVLVIAAGIVMVISFLVKP